MKKRLALLASLVAIAVFISAPAASAASLTLCSDGDGTVCEISDLTIDGNSYNVTFGFTPDFSLASDPYGAINAIVTALVDNSCSYCVLGVDNTADDTFLALTFDDYLLVAGPDSTSFDLTHEGAPGPVPWGGANVLTCTGCGNPYEDGGDSPRNYSNKGPFVYAEFSSASTAPEPGSIVTVLGGVAILALLDRKRRTHQNQSIAQAR